VDIVNNINYIYLPPHLRFSTVEEMQANHK